MQLDSLIWETVSPRTHKPKIVNESLIKMFVLSNFEWPFNTGFTVLKNFLIVSLTMRSGETFLSSALSNISNVLRTARSFCLGVSPTL